MPHVIAVRFPYASRDLWFDAGDLELVPCDQVVCPTERGLEFGEVVGTVGELSDEEVEERVGGSLKRVLRKATAEDQDLAAELHERGRAALEPFQERVRELGLDMKPLAVEYLFGGEKVVCYFVAENRVDFRQLARDLSRTYRSRVDMRQVSTREQAAIMGGIAECGQVFCCARLGQGFGPVTIRMAKDQDLPLNSTKISGACGRLMCCLRYEDDEYRAFKRRAPKKNAAIATPFGEARVCEFDMPREAVGLRLEDGRVLNVPIGCMHCTEANRAQCERSGAPVRPDEVSLEALETLDSPQIRLAIAQLEGESLVEGEAASEESVAEPRPRERTRREAPGRGDRAKGEGRSADSAPKRRRRSRKGAHEAKGAGDAKGASKAKGAHEAKSAGEANGPSPRRSRPAGESPEAPSGAGGERTRGVRRRRHHHGEDGRHRASDKGTASQGAPTKRDTPKGAAPKDSAPKGGPRPGGGSKSQAQAADKGGDTRPGRSRRRRRGRRSQSS